MEAQSSYARAVNTVATRMGHRLVDRSGEFATPPASGSPSACVIPGLGVHNIAYRDTSGSLHELWRDAQGGTGTTNLTANAGAPPAAGSPFAYVDTRRNTEILLYRGGDGTVHSLYWSTGAVGHDNLSGSAGAPPAHGDPVGYYVHAADANHVIYRSADNHLHELSWIGVDPVVYGGNLTWAISAPRAAGDPTAFVNAPGVNIVVYRSEHNQILSLYWTDGPTGVDDLSGVAGTPPAAGEPFAYYTPHDDMHHVVYRAQDGHLWELFWTGAAPVAGRDLTWLSGAPAATDNPMAHYSAGTNTKHVIYRSLDTRLHDISWTAGSAPEHVDLTEASAAYPAADQPASFTVEGPRTQHVVYRGLNNRIYEVVWPVPVTVPPPLVIISPEPLVTPEDVALFDARWMNPEDLSKRIEEYDLRLTHRQAWVAWGVFDDAAAMVRLFELTRGARYLDHLRHVNDVALKFRDDHHPGDGHPGGDNPICMTCHPPIVDRVRGRVVPAWGSGILYTDFVGNGGLNPVDHVTSGVYLYGIAAFARLVAEHRASHQVYGDHAMKFANAALETMLVFLPDFDTRQVDGFVEGVFHRPRLIPTASQCAEARDRAKAHVRQFDSENFDGLSAEIDKAYAACTVAGRYAGKPLAHNEAGALMMSLIELWRALDSDFYRTSPDRQSNADLARGLIPLMVTRFQRYFVNRLENKGEGSGARYEWHYNDDVPDPHVENSSHANLDMFYLDVLRRNRQRLSSHVSAGEPIRLNMTMLRRFANTFLHIAPPAEIDFGGNVRENVHGDATRPDKETGKTDRFNYSLDGWVTLAVADATVYRLCRDILLRTSGRLGQPGLFQEYLGVGTHAALLANKRQLFIRT
jgi:hypothetical protein